MEVQDSSLCSYLWAPVGRLREHPISSSPGAFALGRPWWPTPASDASSDGASCSGWSTLVHLSSQQLKDLLAAQDVFLVNVRSPTAPDIAGTDLDLQAGSDVTPTVTAIENLVKHNLCADIVIYCVSGNTSQRVATPLISKGYLRVRDLQGGITAWQAQGFPVTQ